MSRSARVRRPSRPAVVEAIIETPKGSRNKYRYLPHRRAFELAHVVAEGMSMPFDFGFVPGTLGGDGDPLDVLVLMDTPAITGCIVRVRLLGAIQARQREKGQKKWVRNDRLIAVSTETRAYQGVRQLQHVGRTRLADIKNFFVQDNARRGRQLELLGTHGPSGAARLLKNSRQAARDRTGGRPARAG
jgi:inorganic pyrophosphatase